jgi:hypothetical protein
MSKDNEPKEESRSLAERALAGEEISPEEVAQLRRMYKEAGAIYDPEYYAALWGHSYVESIRRGFELSGKLGGRILKFESSINPLDTFSFPASELRPQLASDMGDTVLLAQDLEEEL